MSVKVLGLKQLKKNADATARELMEAEDPAQMSAATIIAEKWRSLVPVLEGNYRDAIGIEWLGRKGAVVGPKWLGHIPRNEQPVLYARRLETGDSEMPAQPSARPALESARGEATDAMADEFRSVVRGTRKRRRKAVTA